ncbi:MAG: preprotein translocase subunit SecE [Planctomycetes bacterium]|nr:preprotein translocase subunit SecE [Planctomycetota bacterium]
MFIHQKSSDFAIEVEIETRKVTWPVWATVKTSTVQCVVVMLILLAFLFVVDICLNWLRGVII